MGLSRSFRFRTQLALAALVLQGVLATPSFAASPPLESAGSSAPSVALESAAPPLASYHFLLGYVHYLANDLEAALAEFSQALTYDPGSTVIQLRLAMLFEARGEHAKAQAYGDQVLARDPANVPALQLLATVASATGRPEQAIDYYQRIVKLRPDEGEAYYSLGLVFAGLKRYEEAEAILRRGIEATGQSPIGYLYLGRIMMLQQAWARSADAYREASRLHPNFEPAYLGLATALEFQGQTEPRSPLRTGLFATR